MVSQTQTGDVMRIGLSKEEVQLAIVEFLVNHDVVDVTPDRAVIDVVVTDLVAAHVDVTVDELL